MDELSSNWTQIGGGLIFGDSGSDLTEIEQLKTNVIRKFYVGGMNFSAELKEDISDMFSDLFVASPVVRTVEYHSVNQEAPVYLYILSHKPSISRSSTLPSGDVDLGVVSGDDNGLIFNGANGIDGDILQTEEDLDTAEIFVKVVANFVKYVDPTPFLDVTNWRAVTPAALSYMDMKAEPEMKDMAISERRYFWQKIYWDDVEADLKPAIAI